MTTPIHPSRATAALRNLFTKITGSIAHCIPSSTTEAEFSREPRSSQKPFRSLRSFSSFAEHPPTRIGKIARLPASIRSELNHRLRDGQPAAKILPWLNALPEVQQVLSEQFDGKPINKVNLTHWRKGGFKDDEKRNERAQQVKDATAHAFELAQASGTHFTDGALALAGHQFFQLLQAMEGELDFDDLGKILRDLVQVRRADLDARRVEIASRRTDIAEGMLDCREAAQQLAEEKFKHQVKQDDRKSEDSREFNPTTMTFEEALDAALTPPPGYTAEPPAPHDTTDAGDGRALSPKAPCSEGQALTSTQPASSEPQASQPVPPQPPTREEQAGLNPVKADQDRCRAKYHAAQLITQWSPEKWQTQKIIHCA
jgi:hypothetical protein